MDGDTVETTAGTVRLIGIDTPERGESCSDLATSNAERLAPAGSFVVLVEVSGRDDRDRYDRLLRYVENTIEDVGYSQIVNGYADARYDSGEYGTHPRRADYRVADSESPDRCQPPVTTTTAVPQTTTTSGGGGGAAGCDPSYPDFCIPASPPDLDCGDIDATGFAVIGADSHGFDGNGDGVGCEG